MTKYKKYVILIISAIVCIVGVVTLLHSSQNGLDAANELARNKLGDSYDPATYNAILQNQLASYRWLGEILLGAGCLGILSAFIKMRR